MIETLKNSINYYKNNPVDTPNFQVIEKTFYNEVITDLDLYFSIFENSRLKSIKFTNVNFTSSFFNGCFLENCVFDTSRLNLIEFKNCTLKNCLIIKSNLSESTFIETIFDECQFQGFQEGALGQALFKSCHFIKTIFNGFDLAQIGSASLIDSKFSNSENSIEFKGDFYLIDILQPVNGISGMLSEYNFLNEK